jgi:CrcB protein
MVLVDTPGVESVHQHNPEAAQDAFTTMDGAVLVLTAAPPISGSELNAAALRRSSEPRRRRERRRLAAQQPSASWWGRCGNVPTGRTAPSNPGSESRRPCVGWPDRTDRGEQSVRRPSAASTGQAAHRNLPVDADVPEQSPRQARRRATRVFRKRWDVLLVIGAGGALGSLARWAVNVVLPSAAGGFPWATWLENVSGGLVLGALMVLILDFWPPSRYLRPFVGVGVLGGYTTFSSYMLDAHRLLAEGHPATAVAYLFGTLLTGLVAVWAGVLGSRAVVTAAERRHGRHQHKPRAAEDPGAASDLPEETDHDPAARSRR